MTRFVLKHIGYFFFLLIGVTALTFFLLKLAPGDVLTDLEQDPRIPRELVETLRRQYGLDQPWTVQYQRWLSNLLRGDFGYSHRFQRPVFDLVWERGGNTLLLAGPTLAAALVLGVGLSLLCVWFRGQWPDRWISLLVTAILSLPTLVLALLLLILASRTGWFPIGGMRSLVYEELSWVGKLKESLWYLVLPMMALGARVTAMYIRYLRASLLEVLSEPYIVTAYAKGLSTARVLWRHALPNALNPVISLSGLVFAQLLSGSFIVEAVMSWPGLGRLALDALLSRDVFLVMATLITSSGLLLFGNAVADLLLTWHDPRIRLQAENS